MGELSLEIPGYTILRPLGRGGMGLVYLAIQQSLGREVALKVLPTSLVNDPRAAERFVREARIAANLHHPHIVPIHDVGMHAGTAYMAMEYESGGTVAQDNFKPGSASDALQIVREIADALDYAHSHGVVHRDIKPENILRRHNGSCLLSDFGIAHALEANTVLTSEGTTVGTPHYMSPEQLSNGKVDGRSDLYGLGVVLYQLLTGELPYQGTDGWAIGMQHLNAPIPRLPPDLAHLQGLIDALMAKDPNKRPQSGADVVRRIDTLLAGVTPTPTIPLQAPAAANPRRYLSLGGAFVLLLIGSGVAIWRPWRVANTTTSLAESAPANSSSTTIQSLAVLPLDNYSGDSNQEYFAEGMTDELTTDLANISQLRVISRGSTMQFKGEHRPPTPEIAKALNVDAIVEGSVVRSGERVRITAQLIDARADKHLWARTFERDSRDVLALQDELASAIAGEIKVQLTPVERTRLTSAPRVNPQAYDAYLKGRYLFNRPSDENLLKAASQFDEAIKLDPTFSPSYSGLADVYVWIGFNEGVLSASDAKAKAKQAVEKVVQLDEASAEAHTSLAVYKFGCDFDAAGSEEEFRKAIALNPNYAYAHDQFGVTLGAQGRFEEAAAEGERATALDPLDPVIPLDIALSRAWQGQYAAAKEQTRRAGELDPTFFLVRWTSGWVDIQQGNLKNAISEFQAAKSMEGPAFVTAWLGYALAASGDRTHALTAVEELKGKALNGYVPPFNLAIVYLGLGERARALDYLEKAYAADSQWLIMFLPHDRIFDPIRAEPRFAALMKKLGFDH